MAKPTKTAVKAPPLQIPTSRDECRRLIAEAVVFEDKEAVARKHEGMAAQQRRKAKRDAGERYTQAKAVCPHGEWETNLKAEGSVPQRATEAMRYFEATKTTVTVDLPPIESTLQKAADEAFHERVKARVKKGMPDAPPEVVEDEAAKQVAAEKAAKKAENDKEHALATKLLDLGYKELAKRLHPDAGGTDDDMSRLNRVKKVLTTLTRGVYEIDRREGDQHRAGEGAEPTLHPAQHAAGWRDHQGGSARLPQGSCAVPESGARPADLDPPQGA